MRAIIHVRADLRTHECISIQVSDLVHDSVPENNDEV